jgi:hypothetical protein
MSYLSAPHSLQLPGSESAVQGTPLGRGKTAKPLHPVTGSESAVQGTPLGRGKTAKPPPPLTGSESAVQGTALGKGQGPGSQAPPPRPPPFSHLAVRLL